MTTDYAAAVQKVDSWEEVLAAEPGIMYDIIQDVLKIVQSQAESDRVGRRPAADALGFHELWSVLVPKRHSTAPFPEALRELTGSLSLEQFAMKVPTSAATLSRLLHGKRQPSYAMMAALAKAGGVTPAYFLEWRANRMSEIVRDALLRDPRIALTAAKRIALLP